MTQVATSQKREKTSTMLEWALWYARKRIAVFPVKERSKIPMIPTKEGGHGCLDATTDEAKIIEWWTKYPNANIGAATGKKSGNLLAIDLDRKDDVDGVDNLLHWEQEHHLQLPQTLTNLTGGGGEQRIFRVKDPTVYSGSCSSILNGVDIRTEGNYIVVPPSIHPNGKEYVWDAGCDDIAEADDAVYKFLEPVLKATKGTGRKISVFKAAETFAKGERNDQLFRLAASLQAQGLSDDAITAAVHAENDSKCNPPLGKREVDSIIKSATKYQKGHEESEESLPEDLDDLSEGAITEKRIISKLYALHAVDSKRYTRDDIGAANLLSDVLKGVCRYNATAKEWFRYDGSVWSIDLGGLEVRRLTKIVSKALIRYSLAFSETDDKYMKWAFRWNESRVRNNIVTDARDLAYFRNEDLNADDMILNLQNGVLRFSDDGKVQFSDHDASLLLSQLANVEYAPDARCERWERFIQEIMQDDEGKIRYLQKLSGICLTGNTELECMWYAFGATTRNGKSTYVETLCKLLGTYAASIRAETLAQKQNNDSRTASPDIAKLAGKRLVIASEPPKRMLLDTALLKSMTGRDTMTARFLHESEFSFIPKFKLICNTNYLPVVTDQTVFKSERVKVIKFDRHFEAAEQDRQLKNRLQAREALSGILNWCIEGWKLFREEGLTEPDAVKAATEEYANGSDKIQNFFNDQLVTDEKSNIAVKDLYELYTAWCNDNGYHAENKGNFLADIRTRTVFRASGTINGKSVRNVIRGYRVPSEGGEDSEFHPVGYGETMPFS